MTFIVSFLQESDLNRRADKMLQQADKIGCRAFVRPGVCPYL